MINQMLARAYSFFSSGQFDDAELILHKILLEQHRNIDALQLLAVVHANKGEFSEALPLLTKALKISPSNSQILFNRGNLLNELGSYSEALVDLEKSLLINPNNLEAQLVAANCLASLGCQKEAIAKYKNIVNLNPNSYKALINIGIIYLQLKDFDNCISALNKAIYIEPNLHSAYTYRGNALQELKRYEEALSDYNISINLNPNNSADVYNNRGNTLYALNRYEESIEDFSKSISIYPLYYESYDNLGNALLVIKRFEDALVAFNNALKVKPNASQTYINKGVALHGLQLFQDELACYNKAIELDQSNADAYNNRGLLFLHFCRYNEALIEFEKAIALNRNYSEAYINISTVYLSLKEFTNAITNIEKAINCSCNNPLLQDAYLGIYLGAKMLACNWTDFEFLKSRALKVIESGNSAISFSTFNFLALTDSVVLQKKVATLNHLSDMSSIYPKKAFSDSFLFSKNIASEKIKLAFLSSDFSEHPMGYNFVGFFENIDRSKFEVIAISFLPKFSNTIALRLQAAFDHFEVVVDMTDADICSWMRSKKIDIAVDLMGPTLNHRQGIFANRCAPIQVNQYSWTSGAPYMDYIISDPISMPFEYAYGYSEKLAYLNHTLFATDDKREISDHTPSRISENLPADGLVFCCFNNSLKFNPQIFAIWMRILLKVPKSVLWIRCTAGELENNLRKEAELRGVDSSRLIFARRIDQMDFHLARYRLADLFLDTFPFCAQTTASDALWAGLPVVTCIGESSMSRICASLLHSLGMPELVAESLDIYEDLILRLANNPAELKLLNSKLLDSHKNSPVFNTSLYTRNVENLYQQMFDRRNEGLEPAHIFIS